MDDVADKFPRLSKNEIAASTAVGPAATKREDDALIAPIPAAAPEPPHIHPQWGAPSGYWVYRGASGATQQIIFRFDPPGEPKKILPCTLWRTARGMRWRWKGFPAPRPLYGLDRLAARPDAPVIVCEGEKTADAAGKVFPDHVAVTSSGGARATDKTDWSPLSGRKVTIWPDNDEPGADCARQVAANVSRFGCKVSVIDANALASIDSGGRGPDWSAEGWDAADALAEWPDVEALRSAALGLAKPYTVAEFAAAEAKPTPDEAAIEHRVVELSGLTEIKYGLARPSAAKELGIPVGLLDKLVKQARRASDGVVDGGVVFADVEPWDAETDAAALLDEISGTVRQFVVCGPQVAIAVALWISFTWVIDRVEVAPLLIITAPEKRCGKSQLLSLVGLLSYRPLPASNISSAAVFRVVEAHSPTLLLDEADTFMKENEELRGIVNSGHTRQSAFVIRTVGDEHEPKRFSTWGAKAIAGIGRLPETTVDRAVVVELKRKLPSERTDRLRHADRSQFERLSRMLARFAEDNGDAIEAARPDLPEALNDRSQDNWEPLLAIADRAGGRWPTTARAAALKLSGAAQEAMSSSAELLSDVRAVFDAAGDEKISTEALLRALIGKEESPWGTYHGGKPMTARNLAKRVGEYSIKSTNVRFGHEVLKGFCRWQFEDAFARYLPQSPSAIDATPLHIPGTQGNAGVSECSGFLSDAATDASLPLPLRLEGCSGATIVAECGGIEYRAATRKSPENNECSGVANFGGGTDGNKPPELPGQSALADAAMADAIEERAALAADCVPACYLDVWARLNHQKPANVSEAEWWLALDHGGRFLDVWGDKAAELRWTAGELFDVPRDERSGGLIWRLKGTSVAELHRQFARTNTGRCICREP